MQVIPAPALMLRIRLHQEIYLQRDFLLESPLSGSPDSIFDRHRKYVREPDIPLNRVRNTTRMIYSTGIAHKLALQSQLSVSEIANKIVNAVLGNIHGKGETLEFLPFLGKDLQEVTGWATDTGLIQFEISDRAIAAWLDHLIHAPLRLHIQDKNTETQGYGDTENSKSKIQNPPAEHSDQSSRQSPASGIAPSPFLPLSFASPSEIFALQHTHARCCSLLRLAHQEGLAKLSQPTHPMDWQFILPASIPWLTSATKLSLTHAAERQLICQIFTALDLISSPVALGSKAAFRSAQKLNQAFQMFYRTCPIWGSLRKSTELAHARLGLVMVAQRIIRLLIQDLLGIYTPIEL